MGFTEEDEKPRPQFAANAPYLDKNPITGIRSVRNIQDFNNNFLFISFNDEFLFL